MDDWKKVEKALLKGGIAIIPTDTLYGIITRALDEDAVEKLYKVRGRNPKKPCIVLVNSFEQLSQFGVKLEAEDKKCLAQFWPGKISIVLKCSGSGALKKFQYLHRGTQTIAFRMIGERSGKLFSLIKKVGPIVAPSANPEGLTPAKNRKEARKYFGDKIDAAVCYGTRNGPPSTLAEYKKGALIVLRPGAVKL
jgi:L-threonylcarbamoyladenylate synthase